MAADDKEDRWYFTKEELQNTPSRKCNINSDKELNYRQHAANLIQDMGQRLQVSQLCINTAIVYMHRFYMHHSLTHFHRSSMAAAALFLAAKVEEQPRKLEHVIKVAHTCLHRGESAPEPKSDAYLEEAQDLVFNENVLLQTLGFDVAIDHPHTHVVRCCHLVKASKDLAQLSYFMASNSLHLTTMCLQYKPTVVACFCIHIACKWASWEIPQSNEGKHWFWYVDKTVTAELLQQLTDEFLHIFSKWPNKLKDMIKSISGNQSPNINHRSNPNSPFETDRRKIQSPAIADGSSGSSSSSGFSLNNSKQDEKKSSAPGRSSFEHRDYRDKKEREKASTSNSNTLSGSNLQPHIADPNKHHSHHHKQVSSGVGVPNKHSASSSSMKTAHHNHHSRQDVKSLQQMVPQRHSTGSSSSSSNSSLSNRDPNRQRMSRELVHGYNSHNVQKDANYPSSIGDTSLGRLDVPHESNHVHRLHGTDKSHDKRAYDQRHNKLLESHNRKDSENKLYSKYADPAKRKADNIEQRSEEVRKLIEKPIVIQKPRAEVRKEEYAQMMLKKSHNPIYNQPEKPISNAAMVSSTEMKTLNVGQTAFTVDKSPNAPVSASQVSQKSLATSRSSLGPQHMVSHSSALKNGSNSQSSLNPLNSIEDQKKQDAKRQRSHNDMERSSLSSQKSSAQQPVKQRSLFSPKEILQPPSLDISQRIPKAKQKSPPIFFKHQNDLPSLMSPEPEPQPLESQIKKSQMPTLATISSQKPQQPTAPSLPSLTSLTDPEEDPKSLLEENSKRFMSGFDILEPSLDNMCDPIKDVVAETKKSTPISVSHTDTKPVISNPFHADLTLHSSTVNTNHQNQLLSNGLDISNQPMKSEFGADYSMKNFMKHEVDEKPFMKQELKSENADYADSLFFGTVPISETFSSTSMDSMSRLDSYSPLKSAQSISALLQEPLTMPSILHNVNQNYETKTQVVTKTDSKQQQPHQSLLSTSTITVPTTASIMQHQQQQELLDNPSLQLPTQAVDDLPSTVDLSALSEPIATVPPMLPSVNEEKQRSEHKRSEKKKKKEKHKHKDKSKDKHKRKHKDKDKDKKEKEKDKTEEGHIPTAPIKITILKDAINFPESAVLGGDQTLSGKVKSPGLKIKIPKDRLKGTEIANPPIQSSQVVPQQSLAVQPPLKIKISKDAIKSNSDLPQVTTVESRKRERPMEMIGISTISGAPPSKKQLQAPVPMPVGLLHQQQYHQQQMLQQQQQYRQMSAMQQQHLQQQQRQNGRHYAASGNNKPERFYDGVEVKPDSGEVTEGVPRKCVPTSYG